MTLQKQKEDETLKKGRNGNNAATTRPCGWMLHKLRMGGELEVKSRSEDSDDEDDADVDDITKKNREHMKKMKKEAKKNDELWLSGVMCATVIGLLAATNIGG